MRRQRKAGCGKPAVPRNHLETYALIAERAAERIRTPGAHTMEGVSLDAEDRSADLWSPCAVKHDVLGWVLCVAADEFNDASQGRVRCYSASEHIGARVYAMTERTMLDINDADGDEAIAAALEAAAASFRAECAERQ